MSKLSIAGLLACLSIGIFAGIGTFTFVYAKGFSYLSAAPEACVNCHVMRSQYDGWQKSSHHTVAVCVDCHLPHSFAGKYYTKAENGLVHSTMFTLQNYHEPIQIRHVSRKIVNANCVACHQQLTSRIHPPEPFSIGVFGTGIFGAAVRTTEQTDFNALYCTHCHAGVGH